MNTFRNRLIDSYNEFRNLRSLAGMGLLLALGVVLSLFTIPISPSLRIGLGFIVTALLGMLYGPVAGGLAAGVGDVLGYIINPQGTFFFGFTLSAVLGGAIYGLLFYQRRATIFRAIAAKTLVNLFVNALLNTYWLTILLGDAIGVLILPRLTKNLVLLPVEIAILYVAALYAHNLLRRPTRA